MCAMLIGVPAGNPCMFITKVTDAAVMLPAASLVVLNVIVALPLPLASAPLMGGFSFAGESAAVKVGCVGDGEDGELLPHAAAKNEAAMASTNMRFIVDCSLIRRTFASDCSRNITTPACR